MEAGTVEEIARLVNCELAVTSALAVADIDLAFLTSLVKETNSSEETCVSEETGLAEETSLAEETDFAD